MTVVYSPLHIYLLMAPSIKQKHLALFLETSCNGSVSLSPLSSLQIIVTLLLIASQFLFLFPLWDLFLYLYNDEWLLSFYQCHVIKL